MSIAQKTPLARSLNLFAERKALDEIAKRGQALPGRVESVDGPIVTVSFEVTDKTLPQVTIPVFGAEYVRLPVQAGDLGVAFPVSVYLGGISGLGGGTANSTLRGNLSTLVWFPVANKNWSTVDPNAVTLYGPNGVVLRDTDSHATVTLTPTGIVLACGGHSIIINSSGVTIDGRVFLAHNHTPGTFTVGASPVTNTSGGVV